MSRRPHSLLCCWPPSIGCGGHCCCCCLGGNFRFGRRRQLTPVVGGDCYAAAAAGSWPMRLHIDAAVGLPLWANLCSSPKPADSDNCFLLFVGPDGPRAAGCNRRPPGYNNRPSGS